MKMKLYASFITYFAFAFLALTYVVFGLERDPRNAFYDHAVTQPILYQGVSFRSDLYSSKDAAEEEVAKLEFQAFDKSFIVDLKENKHLLSPNYKEIYEDDGKEIVYVPNERERKCYYNGHMPNVEGSWAAISACDGISGAVYDGKETYLIEPNRISRSAEHYVFKASDYKNRNLKCGVEEDLFSEWGKRITQFQAKNNGESYRGGSDPEYMELVVINDNKMFRKYGSNTTTVAERTRQIMNIANTLLEKLNIIASIQTTRVWMKKDWIDVSSSALKTLNNFIKFRTDTLLPHEPHDNAVFITGQVFDGGVLGNSYVGGICSDSSAENIADAEDNVSLVGFTTAHEMGHNLGANHDDDGTKCKCPDEYCVMFFATVEKAPTNWSSCSTDQIDKARADGKHKCLEDRP